ncbi:MAG: flagellar biosynthesis protein FlhB [Planctomycetota bacterium]
MALFGDDQGKTEKPTPTRLNEVRDRGDTPLSRELVQGGVLVVAAVMLWTCGGWLIGAIDALLREGLTVDRDRDVAQIPHAFQLVMHFAATVAPPFLVLLLTLVGTVIAVGYGQIGFRFSNQAVGFKLERLNPFTNWTRIFNAQAIVRTAFAVLKLAVLLTVLWIVVGNRWRTLLHLHEMSFASAAGEIADLTLLLLIWVGVVVAVIAVADLFWQRYSFERRNMMTKQEIEDERKRAEGDPMIKQRQRRARNEIMRHRMMADVPKADVVIVNPTHFSVALRYDRAKDAAPVVVAKGVDEMALKIREIARENDVPLMEDPPLARALFRAVKIGQTIPEKFYQAVAVILGHVYRLKHRTA